MPKEEFHTPVMRKELLSNLNLNKGCTIVDCTVGCGGHADAILQEIGPEGKLVGIDHDSDAIEIAKNRLSNFSNLILVHSNFRNLDTVLSNLDIDKLDGIIFDLGMSSLQLDKPERGFSIRMNAPLDMRMDKSLKISAFDLINFLPEISLSDILKRYGQERWYRRIAKTIVKERKKSLIVTTGQLADLVRRSTPKKGGKIHPATRTFQALRIAVNDELEALSEALKKCVDYMRAGARICVISFHSLEDRIVKSQFRKFKREGKVKIITKKPISPTPEEITANPRARSAKLRVAERILPDIKNNKDRKHK